MTKVTNNINHEIYYVQNPAVGAAALWQFICGYHPKEGEATPSLLLFIMLSTILREDLCTVIGFTQKKKGLSKISEKLFKDKKNDDLYTINENAIELCPSTLDSFNVGISAKPFAMDISIAQVFSLTQAKKCELSSSTKNLLDTTGKLGIWYSELNLLEIREWLKVRF